MSFAVVTLAFLNFMWCTQHVTTENDPTGKNYIGQTEGTFKQHYTQHKLSFRNRNYSNSTELSKYIWTIKDNDTNFLEKLYLVTAKKPSLLNKRTELISKCRHEKKFYLANFTSRQQQLYTIFISLVHQIITLVN